MVGTYIVESTTTEKLAPSERADFWSEHVTSYQCQLDYRYAHRRNFRGGTIRQRSDTYQLVEFWSDEIVYGRTARQVRKDPDEDYRLLLPVTGELLIRQDGQEIGLTPRQGSLITTGAPFEVLQPQANHAFTMTIPAVDVDIPFDLTAARGMRLNLGTGLGRVVRDMLAELIAQRHSVGQHHFDAVCDQVVELLCMLAVGDNRPDVPGHLTEVETTIRRYARKHAADPDLTGASIAHALGWSLRQIQHALQQAGTTPRDLIREERLQLVKQRLHDPAYQHISITDLAHASGFSSASALNSQYMQHHGDFSSQDAHAKKSDDYNRDNGPAPPHTRHTSSK